MEWQFADGKKRFTELVNRALAKGLQHVRRGGDTVVIIAERDYKKLTG